MYRVNYISASPTMTSEREREPRPNRLLAHCTWLAVEELQAVELDFEAVVGSRHDVFNVAGGHRQLWQIFPAQARHLKRIKQG